MVFKSVIVGLVVVSLWRPSVDDSRHFEALESVLILGSESCEDGCRGQPGTSSNVYTDVTPNFNAAAIDMRDGGCSEHPFEEETCWNGGRPCSFEELLSFTHTGATSGDEYVGFAYINGDLIEERDLEFYNDSATFSELYYEEFVECFDTGSDPSLVAVIWYKVGGPLWEFEPYLWECSYCGGTNPNN